MQSGRAFLPEHERERRVEKSPISSLLSLKKIRLGDTSADEATVDNARCEETRPATLVF